MKKTVLQLILDLIFVVIFNIVFFVAGGTEHTASVWVSYMFIHLACIMVIITPLMTRRSSRADVFGLSLYAISAVYFLVEFVAGLIFIFLEMESVKAALIVQIIVFGIYAAALVANIMANDETADNLERHEAELEFVKDSCARLKFIADEAADPTLKRKIEQAYDIIHSSQIKSNIEVRPLELEAMKLIKELNVQIGSDMNEEAASTVDAIIAAVKERNIQLKLLN